MPTLATLQSDVAGVLGLDFDSANPSNGDGPRLLGWANDAVIDMLKRTHVYVTGPLTISMTAGQGDYDLQSLHPEILAIEDLYLTSGGSNFRIRRQSTTDILNLRLFQVTTSPVQMYALSGANLLSVYPTPLAGDQFQVYYVPRPTALANGTDDPSSVTLGGIPSEYHYGLELYMMWRAGDFVDDESSSSGETYRREYEGDPGAPPGPRKEGYIGMMLKDIRRKGGKHLAGTLIPPRNRRIYIPQPGVDVGSQYAG